MTEVGVALIFVFEGGVIMPMMDFARHIIGFANETGRSITNLHLQKIMYFAFVDALRDGTVNPEDVASVYTSEDAGFEVWPYGPVEIDVYNEYKRYGSTNILDRGVQDDEKFGIYNDVIDELLDTEVFSLVEESHEHPFWIAHRHEIEQNRFTNARYSLNDIIEASEI